MEVQESRSVIRTRYAAYRHGLALAGVAGGCLALAAASHVRVWIPGTDVPATLQLFAVILVGLALPVRQASGAVLAYLAGGTAGLPFFVPGSLGLAGPNAGYLVGFLAGAVAVSMAARTSAGRGAFARQAIAAILGTGLVLGLGVAFRAVILGSWEAAAVTGLLPFVGKALVESALALVVFRLYASATSGAGTGGK